MISNYNRLPSSSNRPSASSIKPNFDTSLTSAAKIS